MISEILNLLAELIKFKSVTPEGKDALEFIAKYLGDIGFECIIKDFGPHGEVSNLYATYGKKAPNICFAGHVDVVPALNENLWKFDPYNMTEDGGNVYGRGMVDMKGSIACALGAVKNLITKSTINGSISFLLTTDEEGEGKYGTLEMLKYIEGKYPKIDFCILGEPTSEDKICDTVKIGRRGSINFKLTINGKQGHVAYPHKAKNPIKNISLILKDLVSLKLDVGNEYFQSSNLEVTSINSGGNVSNVIPQTASANFNIRFNDIHTKDSLHKLITEIINKYTDDYSLENSCSSIPFIQNLSENMTRVAKIINNICGFEPNFSTSGGTSDARYLYKYCEVLELGLKSATAHKIDESCKIYDLQILYDVYIGILVEFLSKEI